MKKDDFFEYLDKTIWPPAVSFKRTNPYPLEYYSAFETLTDAVTYARTNGVAYPSQLVRVLNNDGSIDLYITNQYTSTDSTSTNPSTYLTKIDFSGNTPFDTLVLAQAYLSNTFCTIGSTISVTNDSDPDNNGLYIVLGTPSAKTLVRVGAGNAFAPIVHRVTNNPAALSLPSTGDDYLLLPNNSYIYEIALNSLSLNLSAITGATTSTDKFSGYSCIVYFQTSASMTTFTVTNNSASYTFGDYTVNSGTYTFNVLPSTPYIFTVKDNVVTLGPGSSDSGAEELMLSALESIRDNVGLEPDYTYVNKPDPVVISGATDIKGAIFLLDDAIGDVNTTIDTMESTITSMGTDITNIYTTLTDLANEKEDKGTVVYNASANGTYSFNMAYNTSYIYANATGFSALTINLSNVTGTPTSTETSFANIAYEENTYFKATSNSTTLTLTNCNATCVFGTYTSSDTTYTFSNFTAGQWYCLSVRDNCVVCGPIDETQLSLAASSSTDYGYLVTGLSVSDHTITYKHLNFTSTDANKYLAGDGHFKSIVSGVSGTCPTEPSTAAKTMAVSDFTLQAGVVINVTFTYTNTAPSPTLNVGGSGAKAIYYNGAALTTYNDYDKGGIANATITYVYDGAHWVWLGNSIDTSRKLCTFAGTADATQGFSVSGTTLTVTMWPNMTYYIGQYSAITTLVLNVTNVMQPDSIHTPIHYESIVHFYNGYTVQVSNNGTIVDAQNFTPTIHYGSYSDLPINQVCFLSIVDNMATFGPTAVNSSSTDGYVYPYTLPTASSSVLGGVKTGYSQNLTQNHYSIGISSGQIYASVPLAGVGTRGTMIYPNISGYTPIAKPSSWSVATNGNVYPIEKTSDTNEAFVRVPSVSGGGGGGTTVSVADTWADHNGTDAGVVLPTLTTQEKFTSVYIDSVIAPTHIWFPHKGDSFAWCAVPVIMDTEGRLLVALPDALLSSYSGYSTYPFKPA